MPFTLDTRGGSVKKKILMMEDGTKYYRSAPGKMHMHDEVSVMLDICMNKRKKILFLFPLSYRDWGHSIMKLSPHIKFFLIPPSAFRQKKKANTLFIVN